jgi:hypothetical protein
VLLFWVGVFGAGATVDGYSAREDFISSLASRGSSVAALGVAAFLASAGAHLATSWAVFRAWRAWLLAALLFLAALAMLSIAVFRSYCPQGPAGCALDQSSAADWVEGVHGVSVAFYELFVLAAMLTLAIGSLRKASRWPRRLGTASLVFAIGSLLLIAQTDGDHIGFWQRLWLANNLAWLLVVAWAATREPQVRH